MAETEAISRRFTRTYAHLTASALLSFAKPQTDLRVNSCNYALRQ